MKNYKLVNNALGWVAFAIAAVVYLLTIEPTASFWDCGEFISSAYKLEVGHPPGNPIFMLTANLFTQFASGPESVAKMVNVMSALFSALTILFLFWTITHLARRIVVKDNGEMSTAQLIAIMGSGLVGALAYTFSDTFWFSAVEGEVYAFSSLMTALVFWLILKWEDVADQPHSNRWIILIAYLMGLSIAVHLLNLLCIPAIVLVYYYKKFPNPNLKGSLIALAVSFVIVALLLYGLIQGLVEVCGWFELFFVNTLGMSYNSGVIIYIVLLFAVLTWAIWESMREKPDGVRIKVSFIISIVLLGIPFMGSGYVLGVLLIIALTTFLFYYKKVNPVVLNTILISLFVITIGYSSYALIMVRSSANTPMNQNAPEDIFTLRTYLTREQYGETPLLYGQTYASEVKRESRDGMCDPVYEGDEPVWSRVIKKDASEKDKYFVSNHKTHPVFVDELNMFFPRMHSSNPDHIAAYKAWANVKGEPVKIVNCSEPKTVMKPTFAENLKFFASYQVSFMYWRYFMWNFAGRQNDIQGHGEVGNGNWITGIKFLDELRVGPQDNLPQEIIDNKGHNTYYLLPLLLGVIGLLFQVYSGKKGTQGFWITFTLFFMTGLAIVIYLNQTPFQPRERDYAYAGSFYAFCIWIGLGVAGVARGLTKFGKVPALAASCVATLVCLLIPAQMGAENWDDHDRSGRYVARDFGFNYLTTCEPNAVIFTNGDNDTFPLWYAQEVEGYRTDVRVCNLSYLQTDWYVSQMKLQSYESTPLPISWKKSDYIQGTHDVAYVYDVSSKPVDVTTALDFIKTDDKRYKQIPGYNFKEDIDIVPSSTLFMKIDSTAVIASGIVKPENADWIPKELSINLKGKNYISKHEMIILDMLNNNSKDWKRPFYFAVTVNSDQFLRLTDYFRQDGIAYRVVPYSTKAVGKPVDTEVMFDNMMNKYKWGGIENPDVYLDENAGRMTKTFRQMFGVLVDALIKEGKNDKAEQAMDYCQKVIPSTAVKYDYSALRLMEGYYQIGKNDKAIEVGNKIAAYIGSNINWYNRLSPSDFASMESAMRFDLSAMQSLLSIFQEIDPKLADGYKKDFEVCAQRYTALTNRPGGGRNR